MTDASPVLTVREFLIVTLLAAIIATMLVLALTTGAGAGADHDEPWRHASSDVPSLDHS